MNKLFVRGKNLNLMACRICCQVMSTTETACTRCGLSVKPRIKHSILLTSIFASLAFLFYIPANILPMFVFHTFLNETSNTIMQGIQILLDNKLYVIASIVFVASIVIPAVKMMGLILLLIAAKWNSGRYIRHHIKLYRFIERIGRWSMLDVFVISVMLTLLNFEPLIKISIGWGTSAFGMVVFFSMLATFAFDPRLLWDAIEKHEKKH